MAVGWVKLNAFPVDSGTVVIVNGDAVAYISQQKNYRDTYTEIFFNGAPPVRVIDTPQKILELLKGP